MALRGPACVKRAADFFDPFMAPLLLRREQMARPPTTSKRSTNTLLRHVTEHATIGEVLPTERYMATLVEGSRTAVRSALVHFQKLGLIDNLKDRRLMRLPEQQDYFDIAELQSGSERIREVLTKWIYHNDLPAGGQFSEAELARKAGMSTISVREFLIEFSRYGVIEKKQRGGWRLCTFDRALALELADVREMFELAAIEHIGKLAPTDPCFARLDELIAKHERLAVAVPPEQGAFPALDAETHLFLIGLSKNRFMESFFNIVSLMFLYQFQWNRDGAAGRHLHAVHEHLAFLRSLARRDIEGAREAMRAHLATSRGSLLHGIGVREMKARHAEA